jgi:hypothetical protein
VNHEGIAPSEIPAACQAITEQTLLPAVDVLTEGADGLVRQLVPRILHKAEVDPRLNSSASHA